MVSHDILEEMGTKLDTGQVGIPKLKKVVAEGHNILNKT